MPATIFLVALACVALLWVWLNIAPVMRDNTSLRLDAPPDGQRMTGGIDDAALPHVTIICPGRNEASFIPTTLPQLCGQDYPRYTVVYVDDHSDDETPAITAEMAKRYPHLFVVRNEIEPPAGWVGKCWAVKRGYEEWKEKGRGEKGQGPREESQRNEGDGPMASSFLGDQISSAQLASTSAPLGPWPSSLGPSSPSDNLVCFTDADVNWHPQCLRTAVNAMIRDHADVVSLFPGMVFGSAIERVLLFTLTFALLTLFPLRRAMDPKHPDTLTAGAFILTRRSLYDKIGGHESVRNQVVEDVNLGRKLKAAGGRVWIAFTKQLISCRMYEGWSDIWEGLTKNAYAGMEYSLFTASYLIATNIIAITLTPAYLIGSAAWWALGGGAQAAVATGLSAAILILQARILNKVRHSFSMPAHSIYAWSLPIGAAIYLPIAIASIWRYYRGGNVWKGRSYGKGELTH